MVIEIADLIKNKISDAAIDFCITGCFTGDTLVLSKEGYVKIEEINIGDYVYSQDVRTGEKAFKEVLQVQKRNTSEFVKVKLEDEEIQATPSHLFYTNGQWELAGNLKVGDILISANGEEKKVISVEEYLAKELEAIYNFSVDDYHTYFVSKMSVLVHNWMCTKKKAEEITNLLKDGENLKDITSKFKEFIEKYKISDKMDILDNLHRKMPNIREKYLKDVKDLMDSGKREAEIAVGLSKYDKTFSEIESLSKRERRKIRELTSTATFEDVANTVDDVIGKRYNSNISRVNLNGAGNNFAARVSDGEVAPAFKQNEFSSSYESRINQTPNDDNLKVGFEGPRGESFCTLKPPQDAEVKKILDEAGIDGIEYRNGVPDFSPVSKAQLEINYMLGGKGTYGSKARAYNFAQADQKLANELNNSTELAQQFGMESGGITGKDIDEYRDKNKFTWHELNDVKTIQLVPTKINSTFGHLGGVGEINSGAFELGGFATNY